MTPRDFKREILRIENIVGTAAEAANFIEWKNPDTAGPLHGRLQSVLCILQDCSDWLLLSERS